MLHNQWDKKEIKKYLKTSDAAKAVLREKFIGIKAYIKK